MSHQVGKALWLLTFSTSCLGGFPRDSSISPAVSIRPPSQSLAIELSIVNSASSLAPISSWRRNLSPPTNPPHLQSHPHVKVGLHGGNAISTPSFISNCVSLRRSCDLGNLCPCGFWACWENLVKIYHGKIRILRVS